MNNLLRSIKQSLVQSTESKMHWNHPDKLHPLDVPVLLRLPQSPRWALLKRLFLNLLGVKQLERSAVLATRHSIIQNWSEERVYVTPTGETLIGKFEWTYP